MFYSKLPAMENKLFQNLIKQTLPIVQHLQKTSQALYYLNLPCHLLILLVQHLPFLLLFNKNNDLMQNTIIFYIFLLDSKCLVRVFTLGRVRSKGFNYWYSELLICRKFAEIDF